MRKKAHSCYDYIDCCSLYLLVEGPHMYNATATAVLNITHENEGHKLWVLYMEISKNKAENLLVKKRVFSEICIQNRFA